MPLPGRTLPQCHKLQQRLERRCSVGPGTRLLRGCPALWADEAAGGFKRENANTCACEPKRLPLSLAPAAAPKRQTFSSKRVSVNFPWRHRDHSAVPSRWLQSNHPRSSSNLQLAKSPMMTGPFISKHQFNVQEQSFARHVRP